MDGVLRWAEGLAANTDIVVFHEIPRAWQRPLRKLIKFYPYSFITTDAAPYDMAVFSKIPLSQRESWGGDTERNIAIRVHGTTPKLNIPFQLYAVHVASPLSLKAWKRRNRALRFHGWQLRDFVQPNQIMLGDFNTTIFSAWYRRLERTSGLKNAQYGFGIMPTWSFFEKTTMFNGLQIDQMLVSPEIYIEDRRTLKDYGSDHLPTYTKLWLYK
jgi:endonuclease/exonuclease/phosphatase (EEP) superfamily protein YafD